MKKKKRSQFKLSQLFYFPHNIKPVILTFISLVTSRFREARSQCSTSFACKCQTPFFFFKFFYYSHPPKIHTHTHTHREREREEKNKTPHKSRQTEREEENISHNLQQLLWQYAHASAMSYWNPTVCSYQDGCYINFYYYFFFRGGVGWGERFFFSFFFPFWPNNPTLLLLQATFGGRHQFSFSLVFVWSHTHKLVYFFLSVQPLRI